MRKILAASMAALLLMAVPLALADRGDGAEFGKKMRGDRDDDGHRDRANHTAENRTAEREEQKVVRLAAFEGLIAQFRALRASWHENATAVRDACHAQDVDKDNMTKEDRDEAKHCIRDGYRSWRTLHTDEMKDLREQFQETMRSMQGRSKGHRSH